jgi:Brp/Blh family beta-carotene 15,15'-monooxygenase
VWASHAPRYLLVVVAAASLVLGRGEAIPFAWQLVPLAVSVLVLGLPHGAVDHLVEARLQGAALRPAGFLLFCAGYLALAGLVLLGWHVSPMLGLTGFIALTVYHWGQGDLHALLSLDGGRHLRRRRARLSALLLRGALPMLVPLLAFPALYAEGAGRMVALFALPTAPVELALRTGLQGPALGVLTALVAGHAWLSWPRREQPGEEHARALRDWRGDLRDVALLAAFFSVVPPTLSIGLYFCFWHATRHVARLIDLDPRTIARPKGGLLVGLAGFARDAAPLTVAAIGLLLGHAVLLPQRPDSPAAWAAGYLVWIAALTLPHAVVVTRMDLVQGVWSARPAEAGAVLKLPLDSNGVRRAPAALASPVKSWGGMWPWFIRLMAHGR